MEEHAKEVAELLGLLANSNRLMILCALQEQPMTVGELGKRIHTISQPALSQHLRTLQNAGIISKEKNGLYVTYSLADERIRVLFQTIWEQYCSDISMQE